MAYTEKDYPSKKALVEDFKLGNAIYCYQPGPFGPDLKPGKVYLEGPHYPKPHKWYAGGTVDENGRLLSVK